MDQRVIAGGVAAAAVLLGILVVVFAMPDPEPIEREARAGREEAPTEGRLQTRVVTPDVQPAAIDRGGVGISAEVPDGPDIPFGERVINVDPIPATYQGVTRLFKDHGPIVQRCLREVAYPKLEADEGPLPSRVGVVLTVQAVEGTDKGRLTGLEVTGDYERHFTGFSKCLADRFGSATFSAPPAGTVATLSWQQVVPREPPEP